MTIERAIEIMEKIQMAVVKDKEECIAELGEDNIVVAKIDCFIDAYKIAIECMEQINSISKRFYEEILKDD